jgi:hypothetical protein
MRLITENRGVLAAATLMFFFQNPSAALPEEAEASCESKLSGKAKLIYDTVIEKKQPNSDLNELWKEVTRDLISKDAIGREEATPLAKEALACLNKENQ